MLVILKKLSIGEMQTISQVLDALTGIGLVQRRGGGGGEEGGRWIFQEVKYQKALINTSLISTACCFLSGRFSC